MYNKKTRFWLIFLWSFMLPRGWSLMNLLLALHFFIMDHRWKLKMSSWPTRVAGQELTQTLVTLAVDIHAPQRRILALTFSQCRHQDKHPLLDNKYYDVMPCDCALATKSCSSEYLETPSERMLCSESQHIMFILINCPQWSIISEIPSSLNYLCWQIMPQHPARQCFLAFHLVEWLHVSPIWRGM